MIENVLEDREFLRLVIGQIEGLDPARDIEVMVDELCAAAGREPTLLRMLGELRTHTIAACQAAHVIKFQEDRFAGWYARNVLN